MAFVTVPFTVQTADAAPQSAGQRSKTSGTSSAEEKHMWQNSTSIHDGNSGDETRTSSRQQKAATKTRGNLVLGSDGGHVYEDWTRGRRATLPFVDTEPEAPAATKRKERKGKARTVGEDGAVRAAGARAGSAPTSAEKPLELRELREVSGHGINTAILGPHVTVGERSKS